MGTLGLIDMWWSLHSCEFFSRVRKVDGSPVISESSSAIKGAASCAPVCRQLHI